MLKQIKKYNVKKTKEATSRVNIRFYALVTAVASLSHNSSLLNRHHDYLLGMGADPLRQGPGPDVIQCSAVRRPSNTVSGVSGNTAGTGETSKAGSGKAASVVGGGYSILAPSFPPSPKSANGRSHAMSNATVQQKKAKSEYPFDNKNGQTVLLWSPGRY